MRELLARRVGLIEMPADIAPETVVTPALLAEVERALLEGDTHYTVRAGVPELRRRLIEELAEMGGPRYESLNNALITTGEAESLFVTLLDFRHHPGIALAGCPLPCRHESLLRLMNLELRQADDAVPNSEIRLIYRELQASRAAHESLIERAVKGDLVDILNLGSALASGRLVSLPPHTADRTLILGNFDALPGASSFRVGYVAGPERFIRRAAVWKQAFSICSAAPSQRAVLKALEDRKKEKR